MAGIPREYKILGGIAIGAILLGWLLFRFGSSAPTFQPLADRADAYTKGSATARAVLTEFADFQCPACRAANPTVDKIMQEYPQDVRLVFRHFPLSIHTYAQLSANAGEAAGHQAKFWEMHDLLYAKQAEWGDTTKAILDRSKVIDIFVSYAQSLGLDTTKFRADVENATYSSIINADVNAATAAGVNSTPQFFVNGTMVPDPSYASIKSAIDKALGK